jgi:hypothetical protein
VSTRTPTSEQVIRPFGDGTYVRVDETTWPVDLETSEHSSAEWALRYGDPLPRRMFIASLVSAYSRLTDPRITQADAFSALRRAREAAKAARRT